MSTTTISALDAKSEHVEKRIKAELDQNRIQFTPNLPGTVYIVLNYHTPPR